MPPIRHQRPPDARLSRRATRVLFAWVWVVVLALPATARAGEVVLVLSADAAPYRQAETGCRAKLADAHPSVRTLLLKEVAERGIEGSVGKGADAVLAIGTPAATYLHAHLPPPTPLLYCMVANPAGAGLADGRRAVGVATDVPLGDQFALIAEALPRARTLGMLYRSDTPDGQRLLKAVQAALPKDWQLRAVAVDQFASVAAAIDDLAERRADVIWTTADAGLYDTATVRALLLAALRTNAPVFGFSPAFVRAGALIGVGLDPAAQGQQAAELAGRVLKSPGDDAVARVWPPQHFVIAVNLIVADKIGVRLPDDLVGRAAYAFKGEQ